MHYVCNSAIYAHWLGLCHDTGINFVSVNLVAFAVVFKKNTFSCSF